MALRTTSVALKQESRERLASLKAIYGYKQQDVINGLIHHSGGMSHKLLAQIVENGKTVRAKKLSKS